MRWRPPRSRAIFGVFNAMRFRVRMTEAELCTGHLKLMWSSLNHSFICYLEIAAMRFAWIAQCAQCRLDECTVVSPVSPRINSVKSSMVYEI